MRGKQIWAGDEWCDRVAGFPTVYDEWRRLFAEDFDKTKAVETIDHGDGMTYLMPNGYAVSFCCDGNYICEPLGK